MGASSGWNLVARRPPRARVAPVLPARRLVSAPSARRAADAQEHDVRPAGPRSVRTERDLG